MTFAWDVDSSVTFAECSLLSELARGKSVLEVGSWLGRSTIALASTARHVTAVDWHHGDFHAGEMDTEEEFRHNLYRYNIRNVNVRVARIENVWDELDFFDGIFIDGGHDNESVVRDWTKAVRHVRVGGWIAFHDYGRFEIADLLAEFAPDPRVLVETVAVWRCP